jgi:hypothetical protein
VGVGKLNRIFPVYTQLSMMVGSIIQLVYRMQIDADRKIFPDLAVALTQAPSPEHSLIHNHCFSSRVIAYLHELYLHKTDRGVIQLGYLGYSVIFGAAMGKYRVCNGRGYSEILGVKHGHCNGRRRRRRRGNGSLSEDDSSSDDNNSDSSCNDCYNGQVPGGEKDCIVCGGDGEGSDSDSDSSRSNLFFGKFVNLVHTIGSRGSFHG